jgi:hypothetical protein
MIGVVQMRGVLHARIAPLYCAHPMSIRVLGRGLQVRHHLPFRERLFLRHKWHGNVRVGWGTAQQSCTPPRCSIVKNTCISSLATGTWGVGLRLELAVQRGVCTCVCVCVGVFVFESSTPPIFFALSSLNPPKSPPRPPQKCHRSGKPCYAADNPIRYGGFVFLPQHFTCKFLAPLCTLACTEHWDHHWWDLCPPYMFGGDVEMTNDIR